MSSYSNRDFTGQSLADRSDISGETIENSCFSNETPHADIFPDDMVGVTFVDCNLDNCFVPPGNTIIRGSHRFFKAQPDGQDWLVDPATLSPIRLLNED